MNYDKLLKSINSENRRKIAFVVGNGINLYAAEQLRRSKDIGWLGLLKKLIKKYELPIDDKDKNFPNITLPELANILELNIMKANNRGYKDSIKELKNEMICLIKKYMEDELKSADVYNNFLSFAEKNDIPIITTNFDGLLSSKKYKEIKLNFTDEKGLFKSNANYNWNYCYTNPPEIKNLNSDNYYDIIQGFGVWHIHGNIEHSLSLKFGLDDYINCTSKVKDLISNHNKKQEEKYKPLFSFRKEDDDTNWKGKNTLFDIFFKRYLIFIGLSLNSDEVFLRWLLMQRAKYLYNKKPNFNINNEYSGSFVYCTRDDNRFDENSAETAFFKSCGIDLLGVDDYKDAYESFT